MLISAHPNDMSLNSDDINKNDMSLKQTVATMNDMSFYANDSHFWKRHVVCHVIPYIMKLFDTSSMTSSLSVPIRF